MKIIDQPTGLRCFLGAASGSEASSGGGGFVADSDNE
jgi:hypothetical protein